MVTSSDLTDLPGAWTVSRNVFFPILGIGDSIITHCSPQAAELYGYDTPCGLNGQYVSDLQSYDDRQLGRRYWAMRKRGLTIPEPYVSAILRPDGEEVFVQRTMALALPGVDGDVYITQLVQVSQGDRPPMPELAAYGITDDMYVSLLGQYTVAQVRHAVDFPEQTSLTIPETFRKIVAECGNLSTALSPQVTWSLRDGKVRHRKTCPRCALTWWGRTRQPSQCPACRLDPWVARPRR